MQVENESGKWVKLTGEAMTQLGCPEGATTAYALAYSKDRDQEFLQEKEVCLGSGYIIVHA